jgi:hypothetical protein
MLLLATASFSQGAKTRPIAAPVQYRIGILGAPSFPDDPNPILEVKWTDANLKKMKDLGFNAMQINMAWAYRPYDEILNLEDVVPVPEQFMLPMDHELAMTLRTPQKIAARAAELHRRIALCKKYGFHIIFQYGAPFVGFPPQLTEPLPQNTADPKTVARYRALIQEFGKEFPGVDDLMMYTYDQDAWLCSEFGPSPECHGVPVAQRVTAFVNTLAQQWKQSNPNGTLWWEPWELSAGEVYRSIQLLDPSSVGLAIHSSVAEVMITNPADRWFKNVLYESAQRRIPVIAEVFMGAPTEEMEPYTDVQCPLSTLRELQAVYRAGHLTGIKEYFGDVPTKEDPNLRMTRVFFRDPLIGEDQALTEVAAPYGAAAPKIIQYWRFATAAIDFAPWDVSWRFRRIGYSIPSHLMTAATLKGASWQTPDWQSSRRSSFMRTDETTEPNFWEREDIQLRCEQSATTMEQAIDAGNALKDKIPTELQSSFDRGLSELVNFHVRLLAYAYHLRETNLANDLRTAKAMKLPIRPENVAELRATLLKDEHNQGSAEPIASAIKMLDTNLDQFLATYFLPSQATGARDVKGSSITSN